MNYGAQIGVITFGTYNSFARYHVEQARQAGYVIVFCDHYARVHLAK